MKDYDISEKYKRIYQGILKWKQAGYKGLFQYTERIDIPLVGLLQDVSVTALSPR